MPDTSDNSVSVQENVQIPVRDGVQLSARIWSPDGVGAAPVILEILPYRKRDGTAQRDASTHAEFAKRGYVCVRVDQRGAGESQGLFDDEYSQTELNDIEDVIGWLADQPWCTGSVGIMGISWGGFNGLQVAARRPPALKAVITLCSSVDRFADDIHYKGGCQLTENIGWAATAMSWFSMPPDPAIAGDTWRDTWLERLENTPFLISDWLLHATRDAYWAHGSVCENFSQIEAAVLSIGGWHDGYRNTPVKLLEGGTSGPVKAIVGPWNHKYPHLAAPEPRMDFVFEALRWWDRWLKDVPTGVEDDPDYRVYLMDGVAPQSSYQTRPGQWLGLPHWPHAGTSRRVLTCGNGQLGQGEVTAPISVPTHAECGRGFGEYFPFGFGPGELPGDQRDDDALSACFDSDPLAEDTAVLGAATVQLTLSADQSFGQVAVRLCDVAPDGAATLITYGLLNLQFRDGFDNRDPLVPGQRYDISVALDQGAYLVPKGHRLRLAVSPSYWPFIWPEPGDVTLTLHGGQLDLPVLTDATGLDWSCPAPPVGGKTVTRSLRPGAEKKTWTTHDGQDTLVITGDHGETEFTEHGLRVASKVKEVWSIRHDDVTSAHAAITWDRSLTRDDITVSTHIETRMHCDAQAYYVTAHIRAYEGEHSVFERDFHDRVLREPDPINTGHTIKPKREQS